MLKTSDSIKPASLKMRAYRQKHLEKFREYDKTYAKRYRETNADRIKQARKDRYAENREARLAANRAYREKNKVILKQKRGSKKQVIKENNRRWRETNRQKTLDKYRETPWKSMLHNARRRSLQKGLDFDLTHQWAETTWTGRCDITGIPFVVGTKTHTTFSPSLDRIDPKLGYTESNCRFILFGINAMKHADTDEDVYRICCAVVHNCHRMSPTKK